LTVSVDKGHAETKMTDSKSSIASDKPAGKPRGARPIHEIRLGRIRAAIWENKSAKGTFRTVTLTRLYKQGSTWKESASFDRLDLPLVIKVVDRAHSWLYDPGKPAKDKA
jgi:hypothetical protein